MLAENWDACQLFQAVGTQWRYAGMSGTPVGLDYQGVEIVMRRRGFDGDGLFEQLQIMEAAALDYWMKQE